MFQYLIIKQIELFANYDPHQEIESLRKLIEHSNDVINTQLSTTNILIAAAGLALAVLGLVLGGYVDHMRRKVKKMSEDVEERAERISKLASAVEATDLKIQNDLAGLYSKLRKEETITLLRRLEEEPLDIHNLSRQLLSREIDQEGYQILRNAYRALESTDQANDSVGFFSGSNKDSYLLLFFQHFMYNAIQDDELRPELINFYATGFNCAFQRDIVKTTRDLCRAMAEDTCKFEREKVLVPYLKAIQTSKFKTLGPLKDILEDELKQTRVLVDSIEQCRQDGIFLEMFGIINPECKGN